MTARLQSLFRRGDPVGHAYIVEQGPVYVKLPGMGLAEIRGSRLIVGALECFLEEQPELPRILGVSVPLGAAPQAIAIEDVLDLVIQYDFGFHTNAFLARLLELSNQAHIEQAQQVNRDIRKYKVRGMHFAHLMDDLRELTAIPSLTELRSLVQEAAQTEFYRDGCMFAREHKFRSVRVSPEYLTECVQKYRKNSEICREGSLADTMFVLLEGKVAVTKEGRCIATIEVPGEAFGETFLFLNGRRSASLIAETDTRIFVLQQDDLPSFYRRHRDVFGNIASTLARRIYENIERTVRFSALLQSATAVEEESWKLLRSYHERLDGLQRALQSDTLRHILNKHSVL